jgi:hypothetical protein
MHAAKAPDLHAHALSMQAVGSKSRLAHEKKAGV